MFQSLVNQYKHMHWTNQKIIEILLQDGVALAEAIRLMSHIISAEHIWLARITGQTEIFVPWSPLTLSECQEYSASNCTGYLEIILSLNEERFHAPISFVTTTGKAMASPLGDILCHIPIHGSHHRGQIFSIIAQHNMKPPSIDYITYSVQLARGNLQL